jgi:transposase
VATEVLGASGRDMLAAILAGEAAAAALAERAERARGRLRAKLAHLRQALEGRVTTPQRLLIHHVLAHSDFIEQQLPERATEMEALLSPFTEAVTLLQTIPGVAAAAAAAATAIVAEIGVEIGVDIGVDMTRFPSAKHLASWAGWCPGNKQRGGRRLSGKTTTGNVWRRAVLGEVAWSITHTSGTYLVTLSHRLARRRGKQKPTRQTEADAANRKRSSQSPTVCW